MSKYRWTFKDDYTCCMEYLRYVFIDEGSLELGPLVDAMAAKLPHIDPGSLRMKAQNIKQIALDVGLEDSLNFSPLYNYSAQCRKAFDAAQAEFEKIMENRNKGCGDPNHDPALYDGGCTHVDGGELDRDLMDILLEDPNIFHDRYHLFDRMPVRHRFLGVGKIIKIDGRFITVEFEGRTSKFVYPDAFDKFLEFEDKRCQRAMKLYIRRHGRDTRYLSVGTLSHKLIDMYFSDQENKLAMIHLFGVIFGKAMISNGIEPKEVLDAAKLPSDFVYEMQKGINLSKYVSLNKEYGHYLHLDRHIVI